MFTVAILSFVSETNALDKNGSVCGNFFSFSTFFKIIMGINLYAFRFYLGRIESEVVVSVVKVVLLLWAFLFISDFVTIEVARFPVVDNSEFLTSIIYSYVTSVINVIWERIPWYFYYQTEMGLMFTVGRQTVLYSVFHVRECIEWAF